jgi:hypothetical protein
MYKAGENGEACGSLEAQLAQLDRLLEMMLPLYQGLVEGYLSPLGVKSDAHRLRLAVVEQARKLRAGLTELGNRAEVLSSLLPAVTTMDLARRLLRQGSDQASQAAKYAGLAAAAPDSSIVTLLAAGFHPFFQATNSCWSALVRISDPKPPS